MNMERSDTKKRITELKTAIRQTNDPVRILENAFAGRDALVVSCGPSMCHWREVYEREIENNPLVVCIKQSYLSLGGLCDLHFLNTWNLVRYQYKEKKSPVMSFCTIDNETISFGTYDVIFKIPAEMIAKPENMLAITRDFSSYKLNGTGLSRPRGPSIMLESVIYSLIHMGVKRIVTIGWDIADDKGGNTHYYNMDDFQGVEEHKSGSKFKEAAKKLLEETLILPFAKEVKTKVKGMLSYVRFLTGKTTNISKMFPGEAELTAASIPSLISWLKQEGVELEIISNSKWMNEVHGK
ncbi:MAG TPA: hypothetical protein VI298_18155 [Geobacteraceae bacterium]